MRGTSSFDVFCVKIGARISAVAFLMNPKISESLCAEGREITHAQNRNNWTDLDKKIYIVVDIPDIVTYTNFGDHRLRVFLGAGVKFSPLP